GLVVATPRQREYDAIDRRDVLARLRPAHAVLDSLLSVELRRREPLIPATRRHRGPARTGDTDPGLELVPVRPKRDRLPLNADASVESSGPQCRSPVKNRLDLAQAGQTGVGPYDDAGELKRPS